MALIRALNSAISGLQAQQARIDVIGDNIANVDTTGFKESRVDFETILSQTLSFGTAPGGNLGGIDPRQIGLGVQVGKTSMNFSQGAMKTTGRTSDLAIEDTGGQAHTFFVLNDETGTPVYTRDGSFSLNPANLLHNASNGFIVQGHMANFDTFTIVQGGPVTDVMIPVGDLRIAKETNVINMEGNLNGGGPVASSGTEHLSETLYDVSGVPAIATGATLLTNLGTLDGQGNTVDPTLQVGDVIEFTATKGTRQVTATFTIGDPPPTGGSTVTDLVNFLQDAMGVNTGTQRYSTSRGVNANGTLDFSAGDGVVTTATESTFTDLSADFVTSGVQVGDILRVTSGAAAGEIVTVTAVNSATELETTPLTVSAATGDQFQINKPAGLQFVASGANNGSIEVNGNSGLINGLSNIELTENGNRIFQFNKLADAAGESAFTSTRVFDSLGKGHVVDFSFVFQSSSDSGNVFRWFAETDSNFGPDRVVGSGTVSFKPDGSFLSSSPDQVNVNLGSTGANTPFIFNPDFSSLSGFAQVTDADGAILNNSEVDMVQQDGFAEGTLMDYSIAADGIVTGVFSNGLTRSIAQVVVSRFANPSGLIAKGDNLFGIGINSGLPVIGTPGSFGRGVIRSGVLEESNVDLAKQFTELIVGQRAFQANARTIQVADEMLQELVNVI